VGKTLSFGGIINNVQHRVAKNGKGWASFSLEGYDESYEFRIFGEEYLKFRHFLIQNNFTYMRVLVKEGWADKETGKKGEPRLQFSLIQYLQDVLPSFAKKLVLLLNINDIQTDFIQQLNQLFQENKGDNTVAFEIMELEKITKIVETTAEIAETEEEVFVEETDGEDADVPLIETQKITTATEVEEINVVTKLSMPSRKLKVKISNELLLELEKRQINFKLN
jgi:DNA polymerase-3 subunit alpha